MNFIAKSFKAIRDLGWQKIWFYALYQFGLRTGHYRRITPSKPDQHQSTPHIDPCRSFPQIPPQQKERVVEEANQVLNNQIHLFGGPSVPLDLSLGQSNLHWTVLEQRPPDQDIKLIWEPARFGWAITLARAYAFSSDPIYAQAFWEKTLKFIDLHPPNLGRQWQSGQEVAIRLMVWTFCDRVFGSAPESTPENRQRLWQAIAEHAQRIPPTLVYARAQNNNHLISEAAGLYTAGLYLKDHPKANQWHELGWRWLNCAFQHQIDEFGTYGQHSTNYHRVMLQLALFADHFRRLSNEPEWPDLTKDRLAAATRWLWGLTDPHTGSVPNLGANDSALLFPLSSHPLEDFRPVVGAAAKAFLDQDIYGDPALSEMADWFSLSTPEEPDLIQPQAPDMLRVENPSGRAFIHTAHFRDRPSHADQLHIDLWWQGVNVAQDPGTFQYNAQPPWNNALSGTAVHNTLLVDGQDQMVRAGRFLWLDWAQASVIAHEIGENGNIKSVTAEHNGYRNLGIRHQRTIKAIEHGWIISDTLSPCRRSRPRKHSAMITWQLPDLDWSLMAENIIQLKSLDIIFQVKIEGPCDLALFRAGKCIHGNMEDHPTWGWVSPTYTVKQPSLMIVGSQSGALPIGFKSIWQFKADQSID